MSFGGNAESQYMPEELKKIVLDTFAHFPDITFIWKYEADDLSLENYPNVVTSKWLPQNDLLSKRFAFRSTGNEQESESKSKQFTFPNTLPTMRQF